MTNLERLQGICRNRQRAPLFWRNGGNNKQCTVDIQTANLLLTVRDALSDAPRANFDRLLEGSASSFADLVTRAYKATGGANAQ